MCRAPGTAGIYCLDMLRTRLRNFLQTLRRLSTRNALLNGLRTHRNALILRPTRHTVDRAETFMGISRANQHSSLRNLPSRVKLTRLLLRPRHRRCHPWRLPQPVHQLNWEGGGQKARVRGHAVRPAPCHSAPHCFWGELSVIPGVEHNDARRLTSLPPQTVHWRRVHLAGRPGRVVEVCGAQACPSLTDFPTSSGVSRRW